MDALAEKGMAFVDGKIIGAGNEKDKNKKNVQYSIKRTRNIRWKIQINEVEHKRFNGSDSLYVGEIPSFASLMGDLPFVMNQSDYRKSRRESGNNKNGKR